MDVRTYFHRLNIAATEEEIVYYEKSLQQFLNSCDSALALDVSDIEERRYNFDNHINIMSHGGKVEVVSVDDMMKNVNYREGNYVKVPKVVK